MAKTLADMTADERQSCVGMWCDHTGPRGNTYLVIYRWDKDGMASAHNPAAHNESLNTYVMLNALTPRLDLPRAWNPDGTPPEWDWQYADYTPGMNRGFYSVDEVTEKGPELPDDTTRARRLVGEWEEDQ